MTTFVDGAKHSNAVRLTQSSERNDKVAPLGNARPRRPPPPRARDEDTDASHLPAFLLRPFRVKA